ncbi:hypothetical protein AGLY_014195, partial [Aphis glycines]
MVVTQKLTTVNTKYSKFLPKTTEIFNFSKYSFVFISKKKLETSLKGTFYVCLNFEFLRNRVTITISSQMILNICYYTISSKYLKMLPAFIDQTFTINVKIAEILNLMSELNLSDVSILYNALTTQTYIALLKPSIGDPKILLRALSLAHHLVSPAFCNLRCSFSPTTFFQRDILLCDSLKNTAALFRRVNKDAASNEHFVTSLNLKNMLQQHQCDLYYSHVPLFFDIKYDTVAPAHRENSRRPAGPIRACLYTTNEIFDFYANSNFYEICQKRENLQ